MYSDSLRIRVPSCETDGPVGSVGARVVTEKGAETIVGPKAAGGILKASSVEAIVKAAR